jgi:hypothetical protein
MLSHYKLLTIINQYKKLNGSEKHFVSIKICAPNGKIVVHVSPKMGT